MTSVSGLNTTFNTFINSNDATAQERLGTVRHSDERMFIYVHAEEALICGNTAQTSAQELANADVDAYDATTRVLTATGDFTGLVLTGGYVYIDVGSGVIGSMAKITGNTANTLTVEHPTDTSQSGAFLPDLASPISTSDYIVFSGVDARKADAGEEVAVGGVAQGALTADYYGWLQTRGIGLALIDGSETAITISRGVVNGGSVSGTVEGMAAGEEEMSIGVGLVDLGATDDTVPVDFRIA